MASVSVTDWNRRKALAVDSNARTPGEGKAQRVVLDGGDADGKTGNGTIGYDTSEIDTSTTQTKLESIVFLDDDETTTKPYYVENPEDLGSSTNVIVRVYDSGYTADGSDQLIFAYGGGDGTDYSQAGTGDNAFGNADQDVATFFDLNGDADDASPNNNDGTFAGVSDVTDSDYSGGASFDGQDDSIDLPAPFTFFSDWTLVFYVSFDTPQDGDFEVLYSTDSSTGSSLSTVTALDQTNGNPAEFYSSNNGVSSITPPSSGDIVLFTLRNDDSNTTARLGLGTSFEDEPFSSYQSTDTQDLAALGEIRADPNRPDQNLEGDMFEFHAYSSRKSDDWI